MKVSVTTNLPFGGFFLFKLSHNFEFNFYIRVNYLINT